MSYKTKSTYKPPPPDASDLFWAAAYRRAELARCANGEHQPTTVPSGRVVYAGYGRRRHTGDRYCRRCDADLPREEEINPDPDLPMDDTIDSEPNPDDQDGR